MAELISTCLLPDSIIYILYFYILCLYSIFRSFPDNGTKNLNLDNIGEHDLFLPKAPLGITNTFYHLVLSKGTIPYLMMGKEKHSRIKNYLPVQGMI